MPGTTEPKGRPWHELTALINCKGDRCRCNVCANVFFDAGKHFRDHHPLLPYWTPAGQKWVRDIHIPVLLAAQREQIFNPDDTGGRTICMLALSRNEV